MMKTLDLILLFLLALGGYSGFKKGFIVEFFSIASLFIATIGSIQVLDQFIRLYTRWYGSLGVLMPYVLFVLIFVLIVLIVTYLGKLLKKLIHLTLLGGLDSLVGAVLGIVKWAFLFSAWLWIMQLLHLQLPSYYTENTTVYPLIQSLMPRFIGFLPTGFTAIPNWLQLINPPKPMPV